jgi:nucleotide-binding universal stress UspA family protein
LLEGIPGGGACAERALPLLAKTQRIVVASVDEGSDQTLPPLRAVARYLAFHGITAETRLLPRSAAVADVRATGAEAHEADLIVLGAYGHSKARELVFGGCTRSFLVSARVPVLMMR